MFNIKIINPDLTTPTDIGEFSFYPAEDKKVLKIQVWDSTTDAAATIGTAITPTFTLPTPSATALTAVATQGTTKNIFSIVLNNTQLAQIECGNLWLTWNEGTAPNLVTKIAKGTLKIKRLI